ncbi:MAG: hypothetical protein F6K24_50385, partial [Okeania sp. SIO2D1]|nr:hypothetical protein [Okeania sp. SIO2D1]
MFCASFLANVSHDLKTPLQVIIGNAEILRGDLPSEELNYLANKENVFPKLLKFSHYSKLKK